MHGQGGSQGQDQGTASVSAGGAECAPHLTAGGRLLSPATINRSTTHAHPNRQQPPGSTSPTSASPPPTPAGNSPVQIYKKTFGALADSWFRLAIQIKNDTEADREFGWVQEM